MKRFTPHLVLLLLILPSTALAARTRSSATLEVTFTERLSLDGSTGPTPYNVAGCGYDGGLGGVTVVVHSPVAISFAGQLPDANGCISLDNFSTQGAGHYDLDAYQTVHKRQKVVASTSFDL